MKKLDQFFEENARKIWFSCLLNIIFWGILMIFFRACFETNDDISVAMIANGARGLRSAHVICQNYILGIIYTAIYALGQGAIPWYTIIQFLIVYASLTTVSWIIFQKLKKEQALLINGILLCYFGYECYVRMQYTKTAGLACAAGLFLLFWEVTKEKSSKKAIIFGGFLAVWGSLYRFEEAAICAALMGGIGIYLLLTLNEQEKAQRKKKLVTYISVFGVVLALMGAAEGLDKYIYASDPEWDYYMKYNDCRCELTDYSLPHFEDFEKEYKEMGINKTAYKIFTKGLNFYDPDVFPLKVVKTMAEMRPKNELNKSFIKEFLRTYSVGFLKIYTFLGFAILALLWLFWGKKSPKVIAIVIYEILVMGALDFYMYYQGRYLENRVEAGLWFAISLVVIWFYEKEKIRISKQNVCIFLLCLLAANQGIWKDRLKINTIQEELDRATLRGWFEDAVSTDPEGLYLAKLGTMTYTIFNMTDSIPTGTFENVVWYGGWEMGNPCWNNKMKEFGVTNPYHDLIDKEHVYIVDNKIDLTIKYIKKYYQKNVKEELVKEAGNLKVYRIVSTKKK